MPQRRGRATDHLLWLCCLSPVSALAPGVRVPPGCFQASGHQRRAASRGSCKAVGGPAFLAVPPAEVLVSLPHSAARQSCCSCSRRVCTSSRGEKQKGYEGRSACLGKHLCRTQLFSSRLAQLNSFMESQLHDAKALVKLK